MGILSLFQRKRPEAVEKTLSPVSGSWYGRILESFTGAWQQNVEVNRDTASSYWAVFACVSLIAGDISKMPVEVREYAGGIWRRTLLRRPLLKKPNRYQTRMEFFESWLYSVLLHGNAYILKERDARGFIVAMYVLDPARVVVLVSDDGSVYYQLNADNLTARLLPETVPASEIIHHRINAHHHPLVGRSPICASGIAAMQGLAIQNNSARFFQNASRPGGVLTAPGTIPKETAERLAETFQKNYSGANVGRVAVLGDGLKYDPISVTAHDAQLIEQLKMTAEIVCATFKVPPYKLGLGQMPTVNNTASLNQQYYDQCLQYLIEGIELSLDQGLELGDETETWFDTSVLVRMDPETRYRVHGLAIKDGWMAPNEVRRSEDMEPAEGGSTPYMQQQNYSLAALAKRDEMAMQPPPAPALPAPTPEPVDETDKALHLLFRKSPEALTHA